MSYFSFKYLRYLFYRYPAFKLKNSTTDLASLIFDSQIFADY